LWIYFACVDWVDGLMKQTRMQFLLDITLPEIDTESVLPAISGDAAEWLNEVKNSFPGIVATLSPVREPLKRVSKPRRAGHRNNILPSTRHLSTNIAPGLDGFDQLTSRQKDIVNLLFKGCSYREIGKALGITLPTVRAHLHSAYKRLRVKSRAQAVAKIFRLASAKSSC
jgi:DNA-binding CsgD family transcriptional regulator